MSERTPLLFVGAIAAIALLVSVIGLKSSAPEPSAQSAAAAVAAPDASASTLEGRVASLEAEVVALKTQLRERPRRRSREARADVGGDDEELARRIARGTVAREAGGRDALIEALDEGDPEVEDRIGALVKDQLVEEREERWERRQERLEQRSQERVARLAEEVGLDAGQVEALNAALEEEREQTYTLFRAAREDHTWGDAREKADVIRAATDADVAGTLNAEQLDAWQQMRDDEQAQRRGR